MLIDSACLGTTPGGAVNGAEKPSKDGASRGFRELKEALKILESLKNMTVEQLWTGGSPTSPTSAEPASTANVASSVMPTAPEKPTKEKRFLDDIKKLQENLRKTLDNVAIVEEEKMEAVVEAGGSGVAGTEVGVEWIFDTAELNSFLHKFFGAIQINKQVNKCNIVTFPVIRLRFDLMMFCCSGGESWRGKRRQNWRHRKRIGAQNCRMRWRRLLPLSLS